MANPSIPCTGSPDITTLSYAILFDISGAVPAITLTNFSTLIHPTLLTWWYVITTPSGTPIHTGSLTSPDVPLGQTWATLSIPANSWPLIFGNPPCGQVEFSNNAPYICTLYVKDSSANTFSLAIQQLITAPNGNGVNSCGNFGVANVSIQVNCNSKVVFCNDSTNFTYQSQLTPTTYSNAWTLVYPPDPNGNQPANATGTNTPYVNFPIGYSGSGYVLFLQDYASYNMGNGATVKVQYKALNAQTGNPGLTFAVLCNINFCQLQCQINAFYELAKKKCGTLEDPALNNKMTRMNMLLWEATIGVMQPLCGIDVPHLIAEIQKIGDLDPNCNCNCGDTGINFSYPIGSGQTSGGTCCPITKNVVNKTTGIQPAQCPNSYFPVQVYDPTGVTIIGIAYDINGLVGLLNSNAGWQAYGTAFPQGNCQVGWYPATGVTIIPVIIVGDTGATTTTCTGNTQTYLLTMVDLCVNSAIITSASYPLNAYIDFGLGSGPQYVGNVASQAALITALNAISGKPSTITFSAGSTAAQVQVFNSSCIAYAGTINITCDAASGSFLMLGSSHTQMITGASAVEGIVAYGLRTNANLGKLPGMPSSHSPWHIIKIGNFAITAEGDTGKVYFYDITNPLMPTLARTIQLNTVVAGGNGNFTATPTSLGIVNNVVPTYYSLYFPTDYYNIMSLNSIYIFEGKTGTAWNIDFFAPGTGIVASFQSNLLIGKCPRVLAMSGTSSPPSPNIYFTQDGTLEADISGASGVAEGFIPILNLGAGFSAGSISTQQILLNEAEYVWAATYDGAGNIWFMGQLGTAAVYSVSTNTVTTRYGNALGTYLSSARTLQRRGNIKYYGGRIFVASLGAFQPLGFGQGCLYFDVSSLPSSNAALFTGNLSNPSAFAHNILPLGNCLVAVTIESGATPTTPNNGAIDIYDTNGIFRECCELNTGEAIYNLIAIGNVNVYTPNNYVP